MQDVMFVVKCLAVTIVLVVIMQIQVGGRSVEANAMNWIHRSPVAHTLQDVAEGAVKVGKQAKDGVSNLIGSKNDQPSEAQQASTGWFKIKTKHKRFNPPVEEETSSSDGSVSGKSEDRD